MSLLKIISSVQNVSEAISSVLKIDVTVVDSRLVRIAGTGKYRLCVGEHVSKNSAFGFTLSKGEGFVIENSGKHIVCLDCDKLTSCGERAEVCCPIKIDDETIGVIGLIAFEDEQRNLIIKNKNNLMEFLSRMSDLISSKLSEHENTDKIRLLAQKLETVLDSVDSGIMSVDADGIISSYNKKALELLKLKDSDMIDTNIKDLLKDIDFSSLYNCSETQNRQFTYKSQNHHFRGIFDAKPINIDHESCGVVFTFKPLSEVISTFNKLTNSSVVTDFDSIIGSSLPLERVKKEALSASQSTSTVLIQGESGTGKELFARAIHFHSYRSKGPFIPINCAAIPEQLLESELFGYEEGAFTGAKRGGKAGKFELANNGTIFLDEIGDLPLHLQGKLLRVVQEGMVERVGGKDYTPINVRIIAATHKDLETKAFQGEFRQDLFYRLNVIPLQIPSLRERKDDINTLVEYLLTKCNKKLNKDIQGFSHCALSILNSYDWPGNVRELENTVEYAVNMCKTHVIESIDLPNRLSCSCHQSPSSAIVKLTPLKELEKIEISKALKVYGSTKSSISKAAEALGIGRATLYRKIKEYDL